MKMYGGVEVQLHAFLTFPLDGSEWSATCSGHFRPCERTPGTHWIGDWLDPRANLDSVVKKKNPCSCQESNPACPAHGLVIILTEP
jgi:hypothetical protein